MNVDHKASISFQKVKAQNFGVGTTEYQYSKLLTSYASSFVAKQLKLVNSVTELDLSCKNASHQKKIPQDQIWLPKLVLLGLFWAAKTSPHLPKEVLMGDH